MYTCKILADSISVKNHRLTTFEITFPRFILAEVNTHRMLSRNSASSRAIPVKKSIQAVKDDPFIPASFGQNQPGMSWSASLEEGQADRSRLAWEDAAHNALETAQHLEDLEVHKALANRVLEPFKWHTAIVSGTDWLNFFALRTDVSAQPEFHTIAEMMRKAYHDSEPRHLLAGEWHLPLVTEDEIDDEVLRASSEGSNPYVDWSLWKKVSIGRCARVSYLTHDGKRDLDADVALYDRLKGNGHLSPFEHVARPFTHDEWEVIDTLQEYLWSRWYIDGDPRDEFLARLARNLDYCGNFKGWFQTRFEIANQDDFSKALTSVI